MSSAELPRKESRAAEFFKDHNPTTRRVNAYLPGNEARMNAYLAFGNESGAFAQIRHTNIEILEKFLLCVARGEQDKAERLLKIAQKPGGTPPSTWLLGVSTFTDYSGRIFNCTAYEYAYWAKDIHMCQMLERYMDAETKVEILKRITAMERIDEATRKPVGLAYKQHGRIHRSAHFDLTPLKQALQDYTNSYDLNLLKYVLEKCESGECSYNAWEASKSWYDASTAWLKVGLAQRDVPVHIANEYCHPSHSFGSTRQFNGPTLLRQLSVSTRNDPEQEYSTWFSYDWIFSENSGPGFEFAFARGTPLELLPRGMRSINGCIAYPESVRTRIAAPFDLAAIIQLDEVRTAELDKLRASLIPPAIFQSMIG
jgi:hypothetical protein